MKFSLGEAHDLSEKIDCLEIDLLLMFLFEEEQDDNEDLGHLQDLLPDRIAHWKSRFDLVAQRQIFRPITETKSQSLELMLLINFLDKHL